MLIGLSFSGCIEETDEHGTYTISGPDGILINIPYISKVSDEDFSMEKLNTTDIGYLPDWSNDIVSLYDIKVNKILEQPVKIKFPIPNIDLAVLCKYHTDRWEALSFYEDDGKAVVEVVNFSWFGWFDVSNIKDKIMNFFTLRWLDETPNLYHDSNIQVDDSNNYGLIHGSGKLIDGNKVEITILNSAPVNLEIYPVGYLDKNIELIKTSITSIDKYTILSPRKTAQWTTTLDIGESITFEAFFSTEAHFSLAF